MSFVHQLERLERSQKVFEASTSKTSTRLDSWPGRITPPTDNEITLDFTIRKRSMSIQALLTPEITPAPQLEGESVTAETASALDTQVFVGGGFSDIAKWDVEDRLESLTGIGLCNEIDQAKLTVLNLPPGQSATSASDLALLTRSETAVSYHWILAYARAGKAVDAAPFLVFPALTVDLDFLPVVQLEAAARKPEGESRALSLAPLGVKPGAPKAVAGPEIQTRPLSPKSLSPTIMSVSTSTNSNTGVAPKKRKGWKGWTVISESPEPRDGSEAQIVDALFIHEYNQAKDVPRKWVRIAKAMNPLPGDAEYWREYMAKNIERLVAAGLEAFGSMPKAASSRAARASEQAGAGPSASRPREKKAGCSPRQKREAQIKFLDQTSIELRPQDAAGHKAAFAAAAGKTRSTEHQCSSSSVHRLHRSHAVPGWPYPSAPKRRSKPRSTSTMYVVASIKAKKLDEDGKLWWLVKWENTDEESWEPLEHVEHLEAFARFEAATCTKRLRASSEARVKDETAV